MYGQGANIRRPSIDLCPCMCCCRPRRHIQPWFATAGTTPHKPYKWTCTCTCRGKHWHLLPTGRPRASWHMPVCPHPTPLQPLAVPGRNQPHLVQQQRAGAPGAHRLPGVAPQLLGPPLLLRWQAVGPTAPQQPELTVATVAPPRPLGWLEVARKAGVLQQGECHASIQPWTTRPAW